MSFMHLEKANQAWHEVIRRSIWLEELWVRPRLSMLQSEALGRTNSSCPGLSSPGPTHCNCCCCSEAALCTNCAPSMLNLPYTSKLNSGKVGPLPRSAQQPHKNQEKWTGHIDFPYGEALAHVHIIKNNLYPWVQDTLFQSTLPEILISKLKMFPPCAIENSGQEEVATKSEICLKKPKSHKRQLANTQEWPKFSRIKESSSRTALIAWKLSNKLQDFFPCLFLSRTPPYPWKYLCQIPHH